METECETQIIKEEAPVLEAQETANSEVKDVPESSENKIEDVAATESKDEAKEVKANEAEEKKDVETVDSSQGGDQSPSIESPLENIEGKENDGVQTEQTNEVEKEEEEEVQEEKREEEIQEENKEEKVQEQKTENETTEEPKEEGFNYQKVIDEGLKLLESVSPIEKWTLDENKDGVRIYSRLDEETGLKMTRGQGEILKSATEIKDVLMDPAATLKWEGSLIENKIVEKTDDFTIIKSLDQKRAFVAQRETLILIKDILREDGSTLVLERSLELPSHPTKQDCVRAFVHLWACILTPNKEDPSRTAVDFMIFLDPKGWVPKSLFNAVVNAQAKNVVKLKKYMEK